MDASDGTPALVEPPRETFEVGKRPVHRALIATQDDREDDLRGLVAFDRQLKAFAVA